MKTALIIIASLGGAFLLLVAWLVFRAITGGGKVAKELARKLMPVLTALKEGKEAPHAEIEMLAKSPDTRSGLFQILNEMGRKELFPREYSSLERIAESHLVVWLLHPNELRNVPDEIELMKEIVRAEGTPTVSNRYFVFRFRTRAPHWASSIGWMGGVAGPYPEGEVPLRSPEMVFSRLESAGDQTAEEIFAMVEKGFPARG